MFRSDNSSLMEPPYAQASAEALGVFRVLIFGIWFILFALFDPAAAAALPAGLFEPAGVLRLMPVGAWEFLHSGTGLGLLKWGGMTFLLASAAGVRPFPLVGLPAFLAILLLDGMAKGFGGFVNHAQFASLYAAFVLLLFPCADGLSIMGPAGRRRGPRLYGAPMTACALALGFAYLFVGMARIVGGGLEVLTDESLRHWVVLRSLESSNYAFQYGIAITDSPLLYKGMLAGFAVVTLCEVLAPLALFHRVFRFFWLAVMVPFHVACLMTMNIFFWENVLIILVLFTPLAHRIGAWARVRESARGGGAPPDRGGAPGGVEAPAPG